MCAAQLSRTPGCNPGKQGHVRRKDTCGESRVTEWIEQGLSEHDLNQSITAFTKNYTRPHMTQACTPYKSPATRHHTQSTHQAHTRAQRHTPQALYAISSSLSSPASPSLKAQAHDLSPQAATPSLRLGVVDPSGSRAHPRAWKGDNQPPRARRRALAGGPLPGPSRSPHASNRADHHASRRQAPAGRLPNSACCGSWPWRPCRRSRTCPCPPWL